MLHSVEHQVCQPNLHEKYYVSLPVCVNLSYCKDLLCKSFEIVDKVQKCYPAHNFGYMREIESKKVY